MSMSIISIFERFCAYQLCEHMKWPAEKLQNVTKLRPFQYSNLYMRIGAKGDIIYIPISIDMPTPESPSASSYYTLWVCPHHPRPHFTHRVQNQTFQTKFLWKTINTARFLTLSAFFIAITCPFWFKTSKVMTLLTF